MNKVWIFCLILLVAGSAHSQIAKGTRRIGGGGNFSYSSVKTKVSSSGFTQESHYSDVFYGQLSMAYFPFTNFSVGLNIGGGSETGNIENRGTSAFIGLETRYYYKGTTYLQASYIEETRFNYKLQGGIGHLIFLSSQFTLEPSLLYTYGLDEQAIGRKLEITDLNLNIGLSYYFQRKKSN